MELEQNEYGTAAELQVLQDKAESATNQLVSEVITAIKPTLTTMGQEGLSQSVIDTIIGGVFCTLSLRQFSSLAAEIDKIRAVCEVEQLNEELKLKNYAHLKQRATFFMAYSNTIQDVLVKEVGNMLPGVQESLSKANEALKEGITEGEFLKEGT